MKHPIVLAVFQVSSPWLTWVNYSAGIWYVNFNGIYPLVDSELLEYIPTKILESDIGSVFYGGESLLKVDSITELLAAPSFYWNRESKNLYARFIEFDPPNNSISIGIEVKVSSELYDNQQGRLYLPHLKNIPPLSQEKDRLFFKKIATATWPMVLDNANRNYDGLPFWGACNQPVRYFIGEKGDSFDKFTHIKTGRIKDFIYLDSEVTINVQDIRAQFATKMPTRTLTISEYPDLDPDISGNSKPLAFGKIYGLSPICLNSQDADGPYVYMLADSFYGSIKVVTSVKIDDVVVTPSAVDLEAGTITLTAAQVKNGASFKKVRVDFQGYTDGDGDLIENPLDIITFCLEKFRRVFYNNDNYNFREWEREKVGKPSVGIYIKEPIQIISMVENMMEATRGGFLVDPDGRFSWFTPVYTKRPKVYITDRQWLETPEVEYDTDEVLAYVRIGYRKLEEEKKFRYEEDRTYEDSIWLQYNISDSEDFETVLVNSGDAQALSSAIMFLSSSPAAIISGRIPIDYYGLRIGENIQIDVNRIVKNQITPWLGTLQGELLKVAPDVLTGTVEITVRVVEGIPAYIAVSGTGAVYGLAVYGRAAYGEV